ncbi:MAG TPA: hypothetical protein VMB25_05225 [Bryobacteraceae bacterium]|nr:hypothetical protein [Bryobacteraceae bacterium]
MEEKPQTTPVEPPRGFFSAHVDDKGRLKLPVNFQTYLSAVDDTGIFVTSTDGRIAKIYPNSVWNGNLKVLEELNAVEPAAAEGIMFLANHYGADGKIDAQGRVTLPTDLRRELGLENQEVRVDCSQGGVNIYSKSEYEARKRQSEEKMAENLRAAKLKGFK